MRLCVRPVENLQRRCLISQKIKTYIDCFDENLNNVPIKLCNCCKQSIRRAENNVNMH